MLGPGFGFKANIFGLGLATRGLCLEFETYDLLRDMWFSSTVVCKFSAEDNKPRYNGSHAQK